MHTESHQVGHHKPRHLAERFEGLIGKAMVVAVVVLAVWLVYSVLTTGDTTPKWMQ